MCVNCKQSAATRNDRNNFITDGYSSPVFRLFTGLRHRVRYRGKAIFHPPKLFYTKLQVCR